MPSRLTVKVYIVNNSGDTTRRWIDYRQWEFNPRSIKFKKDQQADQSSGFAVKDLSAFVITGYDRYVKVTKDMRPVAINQLDNALDSTATDTVFLRTLVEGKVSLYQFQDVKCITILKRKVKVTKNCSVFKGWKTFTLLYFQGPATVFIP